MNTLHYEYDMEIKAYLNKVAHIFELLRDRGLMGLLAISKNGYITEANNAIVFLFRSSIAFIDAMGEAARMPSVENMKILARSFFESKCYLDYIFKENTKERAIAYQNGYFVGKIKRYKRIVHGKLICTTKGDQKCTGNGS